MAKILKYGLLQYDIVGSSQMLSSGVNLQNMKSRLLEVMKGIVYIYNGSIVNSGGDGAVFAFPVHDSEHCPMDWVVQAGLHCLRTIEFFNEPYNINPAFDAPISVRITCHQCDLVISGDNLSEAHGSGLNWFVKYERNIGKMNAVTITSDLYREISNIELKNQFCEVLNPFKYKEHNTDVVKDLFIYDPTVPSTLVLNWDEYWDSVKELADKLSVKDNLPDLIIGLARGGAVAGDLLSRLLGDTPYVSLWVDRPHDTFIRSPSIAESFFGRKGFQDYITKAKVKNILLVDDHCKTGDSLMAAKCFLEKQLEGLPKKINETIKVKTAVLAKEQSFDDDRKIELDFNIHDDMQMMPYGRG